MIPIIHHVYACTWTPGDHTYFNLITDISSDYVYGRCVHSTEPEDFYENPDDAEQIKWELSSWNKGVYTETTIVDLGHADTLPELFL